MGVLREYHAAMGELIMKHEGTLERFAGDGIMIFFNDPVVMENPSASAARMAFEMQESFRQLSQGWKKRGYSLEMGIGIAQGYATIGAIGFEGRIDYGAIGVVTNLAARLCGEAKGGQILVSQRVLASIEELARAEPVGELSLKGFHRAFPVFNVTALN
jgi:adenylate cyclase